MKYFTILTALLLPLLSLADTSEAVDSSIDDVDGPPPPPAAKHGNLRKANPCDQYLRAEHIIRINQNQTELDRIQAKNPNRAQHIKAENANATNYVHQMQSNSTFIQECEQVETHRRIKQECMRMRHLEMQSNNKDNATKAENAKKKLTVMQSNSTLVAECKNDAAGKGKGGAAAQNGKPTVC
jgi:hypothetical protein